MQNTGSAGFSSCSTQAPWLQLMGSAAPQRVGCSGSGLERMSPALAGRLLSTEPPGKSPAFITSVEKLDVHQSVTPLFFFLPF